MYFHRLHNGSLLAVANAVPVVTPISQGDSHYWTYTVLTTDSLSGSPLVDLLFVLTVSEGQCDLYVTDPSGKVWNDAVLKNDGWLFVNRTSMGGAVNSSVQYGVWHLQVVVVAADVYALSVSETRRTQLLPSVATPVGGVNGSTALAMNVFA